MTPAKLRLMTVKMNLIDQSDKYLFKPYSNLAVNIASMLVWYSVLNLFQQ